MANIIMPKGTGRKEVVVPTIPAFNRLALKYVFEKEAMTYYERQLLDTGVEVIPRRRDLTDSEKAEVDRILEALIAREEQKGVKWDKFMKIKESCRKHDLHYTNFYKGGL